MVEKNDKDGRRRKGEKGEHGKRRERDFSFKVVRCITAKRHIWKENGPVLGHMIVSPCSGVLSLEDWIIALEMDGAAPPRPAADVRKTWPPPSWTWCLENSGGVLAPSTELRLSPWCPEVTDQRMRSV